jgi:hypothetical protein
MKKDKFRYYLFIFLMFLLVVPVIQSTFRPVNEKPLKGAVTSPPNVRIKLKDWFSAEYQGKKEEYLNESFGFRSTFVRINSQIAFTLFRKVNARGVVAGKQNYLYEENYVKAWYGADFIGTDSIARRIGRLKYIQDRLSEMNKTLVVVFAAGKGSFYPEYFPETNYSKGPTNYETHIRAASDSGLRYIDFNRWFLEHKANSQYPLYPKYGIHWSQYGTCLVADSLIHYIEKARNIDMPDLTWDRVDIARARGDDYDIGYGLNLIFKLRRDQLAYPAIRFESGEGKTRPRVLVIADSYYWGMFNFGLSRSFSDDHFWFYNKQVYPESFTKELTTGQLSLSDEISKHDVFILMATEANLPGFGWGFPEAAYKILYEKHLHDRIQNLMEYIRTDKNWMKHIEEKARQRGIPVDSMLYLDADWGIRGRSGEEL